MFKLEKVMCRATKKEIYKYYANKHIKEIVVDEEDNNCMKLKYSSFLFSTHERAESIVFDDEDMDKGYLILIITTSRNTWYFKKYKEGKG